MTAKLWVCRFKLRVFASTCCNSSPIDGLLFVLSLFSLEVSLGLQMPQCLSLRPLLCFTHVRSWNPFNLLPHAQRIARALRITILRLCSASISMCSPSCSAGFAESGANRVLLPAVGAPVLRSAKPGNVVEDDTQQRTLGTNAFDPRLSKEEVTRALVN